MNHHRNGFHMRLLCGAAMLSLMSIGAAHAEKTAYSIPAQPLENALREFGKQSGLGILANSKITGSKTSRGVADVADPESALRSLLEGTGLTYKRTGDVFAIVVSDIAPRRVELAPSLAPAETVSGSAVEGLVVTAQKRRESIQDVPIAISAFTQDQLTLSQIAAGPDLMTQIPNFTFTKTNFSGYSIQIRGIGTQAISATVDPAVAVAFNNTPFIRNRFFEQEFFDVERVEVLRGPQGTLYGRNATAGVVNLISAKPSFIYETKGSLDLGNYNSRRMEGMVNIPLVEDKAALRLAAAWTKRDGYATNEITGNPIDGRDLWSTRLSLGLQPTERISANLIWEHFEESDDRLRSGKQLCKKHVVTEIGGVPMPVENNPGENSTASAIFSQGCTAVSMYSDEAFQTPNGYSLPYYQPLNVIGFPAVPGLDPYLSTTQSTDLRVIESTVDPEYKARTDIMQLQVDVGLTDFLTLTSETAYNADTLFSTQDFNRFNTAPGAFDQARFDDGGIRRPGVLVDGVYCDPQVGCADRVVAVDLSTADSRQFSQELRLSSDYEGPFNFSVGANFLRYDTIDKYYVFVNTLGLFSAMTQAFGNPYQGEGPYVAGVSDNSECLDPGMIAGDPSAVHSPMACIYMDPNPIGSLNDLGHNYFLSKNPYRLISYAAFGEVYYNFTPSLKLTAGLRLTVDRKRAPQIPSWLLVANTYGYPVKEVIEQEWTEPTGRLAIDWKPDLAFTDETLFYASYAHGYKAGGANPPPTTVTAAGALVDVGEQALAGSVAHPKTFDAEFIDAFEIGAKNTLFDSAVTVNTTAFYYDYEGYQISQIVDRTAVNLNFDATVWGMEIEADWQVLENLRFGFKGGYENTRMADGSRAIDLMDRTAGNSDWVVVRPFPTVPSNCILPVWLVTYGGEIHSGPDNAGPGTPGLCAFAYIGGLDPITEVEYVPNPTITFGGEPLSAIWNGYPGFDPTTAPNNGEGFFKDLSGNELPNAPHYTATLTGDFTVPLPNEWLLTLHTDLYWQSKAWTRVFNSDPYDRLKPYSNINLAAVLANDASGWTVMAYVKNVLDKDSITGAFLGSDDTGLTTNVFLTEPRVFGMRLTKQWTGDSRLAGWFDESDHKPGEPYAFTLELGGGPSRIDAENEVLAPEWVDTFRPSAGFPLSPQSDDLDWGDQRDIKLTYAPDGADGLRLSGRLSYGEANASKRAEASETEPDICIVYQGQEICGPGPVNWGADDVRDEEDFSIVEFMVGKNVGFGALGENGSSALSVGLRYAEFTSQTKAKLSGDPDHNYPPDEDPFKYDRHWHDYDETLTADRSFAGVGPQAAWDASARLFGAGDVGHVDLDWGVNGGVLFGKQKVNVSDELTGVYTTGAYLDELFGADATTPIAASFHRHDVKPFAVPNAGASLGLSYSLDRLKVGAGYRWERYFDVLDGGIGARQAYDRTIDGPYFKVAVGFGG